MVSESPNVTADGTFHVPMSDRQHEAMEALNDPTVEELLFGGAKGGAKSVFGCLWSYMRAYQLIDELKLRERDMPPVVVGFMGRKIGKDFRNTTLETWRRFIPPAFYRLVENRSEIIIQDKVKIRYGGLDRSEDVQQFNSAEFVFFFLDQAEECSKDDVMTLRATRNRLQVNGVKPRCNALFTANPRKCWLRTEFILNPSPQRRYIKALPADNPWLGADYIRTLKEAFAHRPELLDAYLNGNWDLLEGTDIIIREEWIQHAGTLRHHVATPRWLITCDPARFGDDETVIYVLKETDIAAEEIYGQKSTTYTANRLAIMVRNLKRTINRGEPDPKLHQDVAVAIDVCGLGAGIADQLIDLGVTVYQINGAEKAEREDLYYNKRAEVWAEAGKDFEAGDCPLHWDDPVLVGQLCTPTYRFKGARTLVQDKEEIKELLERSPDRADAYVQGLYVMRRLPVPAPRRKSRWENTDAENVENDWRAQ